MPESSCFPGIIILILFLGSAMVQPNGVHNHPDREVATGIHRVLAREAKSFAEINSIKMQDFKTTISAIM